MTFVVQDLNRRYFHSFGGTGDDFTTDLLLLAGSGRNSNSSSRRRRVIDGNVFASVNNIGYYDKWRADASAESSSS
jgi:hypothetical protein